MEKTMKQVYVAGPWFTPEQNEIIEEIKKILTSEDVSYFSPKDENLFDPGGDVKAVLLGNVQAINYCDYIIAVTDGKDVGTIFEAGYAYAKGVPILYVWLSRQPGQKFNVMLGGSGEVVHTYEDLATQIRHRATTGMFMKTTDSGIIYE
jgi:nucleoside 2-deoxyribosyltransferase